jgi:hypothetical protein
MRKVDECVPTATVWPPSVSCGGMDGFPKGGWQSLQSLPPPGVQSGATCVLGVVCCDGGAALLGLRFT